MAPSGKSSDVVHLRAKEKLSSAYFKWKGKFNIYIDIIILLLISLISYHA